MPDGVKFGKQLNPRQDARTLKLRDYLTVPMPPPSRNWDHSIVAWGMMGNDVHGDCTIAAVGHAVQETTANVASEVTIPDSTIISTYFGLTGGPDSGLMELDVLKYWQKTGIGGHRNAGYAQCSLANLDDVKACVNLLGFCYIGFVVPDNCIQQFNAGQPWDDSGTATNEGHAVIVVDFDATGGTVITWGRLQRFTWAWWHKFVDEAWGVVLPDWIAASGQSPSGFNLAQLQADVQQLQQAPAPAPWQVDPVLVSWLTWRDAAGLYVLTQYLAGNVAAAKAEEPLLAQYEPGIAKLVAGEPDHGLPAAVPSLPS